MLTLCTGGTSHDVLMCIERAILLRSRNAHAILRALRNSEDFTHLEGLVGGDDVDGVGGTNAAQFLSTAHSGNTSAHDYKPHFEAQTDCFTSLAA